MQINSAGLKEPRGAREWSQEQMASLSGLNQRERRGYLFLPARRTG
ncbi:hypothetical protein [Stenotrophomonas sp. Marseille-Q4652]|nr:hypothetical protein [Stenotrophomonas sp. Marseille-Q4652]